MTTLEIETTGPQINAPPHTVINAIDTAIGVFPKRSQVHKDAFYVWHENYSDPNVLVNNIKLTLILRRSRTGTIWFYTSTSNKRAARPKLYTKSLTRDLKRMYSRRTLVRISIKL